MTLQQNAYWGINAPAYHVEKTRLKSHSKPIMINMFLQLMTILPACVIVPCQPYHWVTL